MQNTKSPSGASNARPVYLTCKNQGHLAQTFMRDSKRNHKLHVRSDTLYHHLIPNKMDMQMTNGWTCKEPPVNNGQIPSHKSYI